MATLVWRGDAKAVAQVTHVTFKQIEAGDVFNLTINRKTVSVTAVTAGSSSALVALFVTAITAAGKIIAEWSEVTPTASGSTLVLTGPSSGKPFTVTGSTGDAGNLAVNIVETVAGYAGLNEVQRVTIPGTATGGTFTLDFNSQGPTAALTYDESAADIESALEAIDSAGNFDVSGSAGGPWDIEFIGDYANQDVSLLVGDGTSITKGAGDYPILVKVVQEGDPGDNEKQEIWLPGPPTGGTFTLTWGGATTNAIAYNASAATIQTALETDIAAISAGDVSVTAGSQSFHWIVEFTGTYRNTDVEVIEGNGDSLTGATSVSNTITTEGHGTINEVQRVTLGVGFYQCTITEPRSGVAETHLIQVAQGSSAVDVFTTGLLQFSFLTSNDIVVTNTGTTLSPVFRVEFTGTYAGTDFALMSFTASSTSQTTTATELVTGGGTATDQVVRVELVGGPTGGTFTLTFRGQTTAPALDWDATAAEVKAALDALSTISSVSVTGAAGGPWVVTFDGTGETGQTLPNMSGSAASLTGSAVNVSTVQTYTPATNEVQSITLLGRPKGGTFTLTYDGATTAALDYDYTAAEIETALDGLVGINDCEVSGPDGGPWVVEFQGTQIGTDMLLITGDGSSLSGADILVEVSQASAKPVDEVQTVTLGGSPDGGTFTLTYSAQTTGNIVWNATAQSVRLALEALSNIAIGDVDVSGSPGGPWSVTFIGTLAATDVVAMTGSAANLTATGTQEVSVTASTSPTGPNWWDEANNWHNPAAPSTATAPAAGDTIWFADNDVDCLYGLDTNTGDTLAELHVTASYTGKLGLASHNGDYWEYRVLDLTVGITALYIGEGEGGGSSRIRLDLESVASTIEVYRTGRPSDDLPAFIYQNGHANTTMTVFRGSVGVAMGRPGDTANLLTLTVGRIGAVQTDAEVEIGEGCAAITTVNKSGGDLTIHNVNVTTLVQENGKATIDGAATVGTLTVDAGTFFYNSSGTCTQGYVGDGGLLDFRQSDKSRTFTDLSVYAGGSVQDPHRTLTVTNGIELVRRGVGDADGKLDFGTHINVAITAGA